MVVLASLAESQAVESNTSRRGPLVTDPETAILVEQVREALDDLTAISLNEPMLDEAAIHEDSLNAYAALATLAERLQAVEDQAPPTPEEWHALNERLGAAERERDWRRNEQEARHALAALAALSEQAEDEA